MRLCSLAVLASLSMMGGDGASSMRKDVALAAGHRRMEASAPFETPLALRQAVEFWQDLFLHHGGDELIFHDRDDVTVVWQVAHLAPPPHGIWRETDVAQAVREMTAALALRLQRLSQNPSVTDPLDAPLLAVAQATGRKDFLVGAWQRLHAQRGMADAFAAAVLRARTLLPPIRRIFVAAQIPAELACLPAIETMFNPNARSAAGALGLWQLMPEAAKAQGLHVSATRDDRQDPTRATRAAARILRANYALLGSWPLAITAYDFGGNGLRRAMSLAGSSDLTYLIANYKNGSWGFASKNYYAEFLATLRIFEQMHLFDKGPTDIFSSVPSVDRERQEAGRARPR